MEWATGIHHEMFLGRAVIIMVYRPTEIIQLLQGRCVPVIACALNAGIGMWWFVHCKVWLLQFPDNPQHRVSCCLYANVWDPCALHAC